MDYSKKLNQEQLMAINNNKSLFLVACPGSGKTRTLTYKIIKELQEIKDKKKWIVAITYTHSAADEIKDRIEYLGVNTDKLWIGTIHAFCVEWILKPYAGYIKETEYGFKIINSHETEEILTELCHSLKGISYYDCGYYYSLDSIILSCVDSKKTVVNSIIEKYHNILLVNNQIDFEQILHLSYKLIMENPSISKVLSMLFSYILVDEYQDTKEIQYAIFGSILNSGNGLVKTFIVGDPNQAIYNSLGGYAMSCNDFKKIANIEIEEKSLEKNYRNSSRIIDFFKHYRVFESPITAMGDNSSFPSQVQYSKIDHVDNLANCIVDKVKYYVIDCEINQNELCIVAPWWVHLASMTRKLTTLLPEYSFNGPGLTPFSRDVDNFWYKLTKLILTEPSPTLYIRRVRWAKELIDELNSSGASTDITYRDILRKINFLRSNIKEEDGLIYLSVFFDEFFYRIEVDYKSLPTLAEHHEAFFDSSQKRIKKIRAENSIYDGSVETFKQVFMPKSGITVSTIHGVKGKEFDAVIGYGLLDGFVPHFSDKSEDSEKKLIYVLCSRARKHLCLISENGRIDRYTKQSRQPSPSLNSHVFNYD